MLKSTWSICNKRKWPVTTAEIQKDLATQRKMPRKNLNPVRWLRKKRSRRLSSESCGGNFGEAFSVKMRNKDIKHFHKNRINIGNKKIELV